MCRILYVNHITCKIKHFYQSYQMFDQANPSVALVDELLRIGIQVIVCGQSMMKQSLLPEDIYAGVRMAVSRFTATSDLIGKGYQVIVL